MSVTPGVGELTTQGVPETTPAGVGQATSEAGAIANTGLVKSVERAVTQAPGNRVQPELAGMAVLAGSTADQIPDTTVPQEQTTEVPEPVVDPVQTEASAASKSNPRYFSYAAEATKALEEAKARGASQSDIEGLELKLQQATTKEGLLMTGIALIQIDKEIAEAQQRGATQEELSELTAKKAKAVKARETLYEESFKQIKAHVERNKERDPRTFEQAVDDFMLKEAREIMDAMQLGLTRAIEAGDEGEIADAKLRLQAAEMHVGIIEKKKGRGIKALLKTILASAGATVITDTFKVSKGEVTPQTGH